MPGSGVALMNISSELKSGKSDAEKIAYAILLDSLLSPLKQILENAGLNIEDIYLSSKLGKGEGYNVVTEKKGKMIATTSLFSDMVCPEFWS